MIGFLYLRHIEDWVACPSLERGSLLDIIFGSQDSHRLMEESIKRLRHLEPPIDQDAAHLRPRSRVIEKASGTVISDH